MGAGIAEVCVRAGYDTVVREVSDELLQKGLARIGRSLDRAVEKGKLDGEQRDAALGRLRGVVALDALEDRFLGKCLGGPSWEFPPDFAEAELEVHAGASLIPGLSDRVR